MVGQGLDPALNGGGVDSAVSYRKGCDEVDGRVGVIDHAVKRVAALSYFLVTFAPSRTLDTSFCCGWKKLVSLDCHCHISLSNNISEAVS